MCLRNPKTEEEKCVNKRQFREGWVELLCSRLYKVKIDEDCEINTASLHVFLWISQPSLRFQGAWFKKIRLENYCIVIGPRKQCHEGIKWALHFHCISTRLHKYKQRNTLNLNFCPYTLYEVHVMAAFVKLCCYETELSLIIHKNSLKNFNQNGNIVMKDLICFSSFIMQTLSSYDSLTKPFPGTNQQCG